MWILLNTLRQPGSSAQTATHMLFVNGEMSEAAQRATHVLPLDVMKCQTLQLSSRHAHGAECHLQVVPMCNEISTGLDWQIAHFLVVWSERSDRSRVFHQTYGNILSRRHSGSS